ncbi:hypothetical protein CASFOL_022153 [Castilleja foliolosa]|uniref:NB-ARC domain-containing protein n=1 Tax=Castilleja foliolosa TaxID=1961234 RepID=A0ABD3CZX8_9LAMI
MAYVGVFSALQSLKQKLLDSDDGFPRSLYDKLCSLQSSFNENTPALTLDPLQIQIPDEIYDAQNPIESSNSNLEIQSLLLQETTAQNILASVNIDEIVGQEKNLELLTSMLLNETPNLEIIPIVGMPCIGKTTLAQTAFEDMRVQNRFSTRAWVTIYPGDPVAVILGKLLDSIDIEGRNAGQEEVGLSTYLHRVLFNNRYLIVMDDMWDSSTWDYVRKSLPDNKNGSRIVLTTTISRLAELASSSANNILRIPFLNEDESWKLLYHTVFNHLKQPCNSQLEKIGKNIAKNCEGLPLAIIEVGKALREMDLTIENWTRVAEYENPLIIIRREGNTCPISKRLSRSYKQLPRHLHECFLYMGIFPKNYEIPTSKLFKLWVAEGFFETQTGKSLDEMTGECLDVLVSRSLVLLGEQTSKSGTNRTCRLHFVFRNLCVDEAKNEKFFHVVRKYDDSFTEGINNQRRLCIHNNTVLGLKEVKTSMETVSSVGSLLCFGLKNPHPFGVYLHFKSLKVLDALTIRFYDFPQEIKELVQLRHLAITYDGELIPGEIWELSALKHLECIGFDLPNPIEEDSHHVLGNLSTLVGVSALSCAHHLLDKMPNLKKLEIRIESTHLVAEDFSFFSDVTDICCNIESFECAVMHPSSRRVKLRRGPAFPANLRKITLSGCGFLWEDMSSAIGGLPNLQTLKLQCYAFRGAEWETYGGEFTRLEFLLLEDLDIEVWRTSDCGHFPSLKHVIVRHCYRLEEIPRELGDIATLEMMEVESCSTSAMDSARRIQKEQLLDWGNDYLKFRILDVIGVRK